MAASRPPTHPPGETETRNALRRRSDVNPRESAALSPALDRRFGLFVPLIGIETRQNIHNELVLVDALGLARPSSSRSSRSGASLRRLFVRAVSRRAAKAVGQRTAPVAPPLSRLHQQHFAPIGARRCCSSIPFIVLPLAGFQGSLKWVDNFGIQILIYVMLGWGLNIVVGLAGLLDLGYVAFYAVGAYAYALLGHRISACRSGSCCRSPASWPPCWGVVLGFPVLRLRGDYLAIVTLAFGEIIRLVLINWREVTNGWLRHLGHPQGHASSACRSTSSPNGFAADVRPAASSSAYYKIFLYYLILLLALLTAFVTIRLRRLPIGRAWESLREDEIACRSLGINTTNTKLTAFAIGAMFGGFAGSFFAARQGFVSPGILHLPGIGDRSLAIVVLGGMGSLIGIAVAAVVMIGGTEILREMEFLKVVFGDELHAGTQYRMLLFGLAMVVDHGVEAARLRAAAASRRAFLHERKIGVGRPSQGRARLMSAGTAWPTTRS